MAESVNRVARYSGAGTPAGEGEKMKSELLKELWEKGIAYLLQEYT
jgi:hypothetical protein